MMDCWFPVRAVIVFRKLQFQWCSWRQQTFSSDNLLRRQVLMLLMWVLFGLIVCLLHGSQHDQSHCIVCLGTMWMLNTFMYKYLSKNMQQKLFVLFTSSLQLQKQLKCRWNTLQHIRCLFLLLIAVYEFYRMSQGTCPCMGVSFKYKILIIEVFFYLK